MLGRQLEDLVEIRRVEPFYRCFFEEDSSWVDISRNSELMNLQIDSLEEDAWGGYQRYMDIASSFLNFGLPNVIEERWDSTHLIPFIRACIQAFPLLSHDAMLRTLFNSPKLRAMLSFQDLYIGLSPSEAPAVFSLLQALEFDQGIYYPVGGFTQITSALERIATESGVNIHREYTVQDLVCSKSTKEIESMVVVNRYGKQEVTAADVFIINQDAPAAESSMVPPEYSDKRIIESRPSCGVVSLSFGFNATLSPLQHHNVFFSSEYERSWDAVSNPEHGAFDPSTFNFYVHCPSRTDQSCCPVGHEAITVLVPVPPLSKSGSQKLDLQSIRHAVLSRLQSIPGMPHDIESSITVEKIREPSLWSHEYGLFRGSAFGLAHSLDQLSFLRPRLKHPHLSNVYRVGASVRPGNGVPLVMISARLVSDLVLKR